MSMVTGEQGKLFGYNTGFDLTNNTELALEFISPASSTPIVILASRLSVGSVDKVFSENDKDVTYLAGQYMQFITLSTDFVIGGQWHVCGTYTNDNVDPIEIFKGELEPFDVGFGC